MTSTKGRQNSSEKEETEEVRGEAHLALTLEKTKPLFLSFPLRPFHAEKKIRQLGKSVVSPISPRGGTSFEALL